MWNFKTVEIENGKETNRLNPIHALYLDYLNNWLSIDAFAECYGIDTKTAQGIIEAGRTIHKMETGNF